MTTRPKLFSAFALCLSLAACGGGDGASTLEEANAALGSQDYAAARDKFAAAASALDPSDPNYLAARQGEIEALIHVDAEEARNRFLELAADHPEQIGEREYRNVVQKMQAERKATEAVPVLHAAIERFPDSARLDEMMEQLKKDALSGGDAETVDALKGLGYIGGD